MKKEQETEKTAAVMRWQRPEKWKRWKLVGQRIDNTRNSLCAHNWCGHNSRRME